MGEDAVGEEVVGPLDLDVVDGLWREGVNRNNPVPDNVRARAEEWNIWTHGRGSGNSTRLGKAG